MILFLNVAAYECGSGTTSSRTTGRRPSVAERYAAAMSRRFAGLRVTSDPIPDTDPARTVRCRASGSGR